MDIPHNTRLNDFDVCTETGNSFHVTDNVNDVCVPCMLTYSEPIVEEDDQNEDTSLDVNDTDRSSQSEYVNPLRVTYPTSECEGFQRVLESPPAFEEIYFPRTTQNADQSSDINIDADSKRQIIRLKDYSKFYPKNEVTKTLPKWSMVYSWLKKIPKEFDLCDENTDLNPTSYVPQEVSSELPMTEIESYCLRANNSPFTTNNDTNCDLVGNTSTRSEDYLSDRNLNLLDSIDSDRYTSSVASTDFWDRDTEPIKENAKSGFQETSASGADIKKSGNKTNLFQNEPLLIGLKNSTTKSDTYFTYQLPQKIKNAGPQIGASSACPHLVKCNPKTQDLSTRFTSTTERSCTVTVELAAGTFVPSRYFGLTVPVTQAKPATLNKKIKKKRVKKHVSTSDISSDDNLSDDLNVVQPRKPITILLRKRVSRKQGTNSNKKRSGKANKVSLAISSPTINDKAKLEEKKCVPERVNASKVRNCSGRKKYQKTGKVSFWVKRFTRRSFCKR